MGKVGGVFLKNYTSDVPVSQTIAKIESVLIRCGVTGIEKEYASNAEVTAMKFRIKFDGNTEVSVRLPADTLKAQNALWMDYANGDTLSDDQSRIKYNPRKSKTRAHFAEQAKRTAWKIIQDWVEVQMSMIQMKQADFQEVFLPYIMVDGGTYYQQLRGQGFKALLPPPSNQE